jgi:hypothetical protein
MRRKLPGHHLFGFQLVEGAAAASITALGNYPDTSIPLSTQRRSGGHAQPHCPSEPRFYKQKILMKKQPASKSAFFNPGILIDLASCSIGLLLALLAFALYPGGNALAKGPQQDVTVRETPDASGTLGTKDIVVSQGFDDSIEPNNTFRTTTPLVSSCVVTVLPNNGANSGNERAPNTNFRYGRSVYLITAAELAAVSYPSGEPPTTIGWNYQFAPGLTGSAPLIVYLQNTTDTTNNKSTTWATAISGMTVVHNAMTTLPNVAGPFDITFSGGSFFTYTGGGLYLAFDWGQYTGTLSTTAQVYCNTSLVSGLLGNQSNIAAPMTLAPSNFRPETRLGSSIQNDVATSIIYAFGELPRGLVPAQTIKAVITNKGVAPQANLPVTLNISGVETFMNTQTIPSLASCGGVAIVTFAPFTPTVLGSDTVTVSVPPDDVPANNSLSKPLSITVRDYSYKYPGTTANGGIGLTGATATFVAKFPITAANAITDVKLEFFRASSQTYKVAIYPDSGSGTPSTTPLYVDSAARTVLVPGPVTITLPGPVAVSAGNFYVGIQQNTRSADLSFDNEVPVRTGSFFYGSPNPVTTWFDFSPSNNFKLNIGVILQNAGPTPTPPSGTPTPMPTITPTPVPTPTASGTPVPTPTPVFEGNFVIGDLDAVVGNHVTFWSPRWARLNSLSGGPAPDSFKGFARHPNPDPAQCGGTWTSTPGNSSHPRDDIPRFITVIASSRITQSGSTIMGDVPILVVVRTDEEMDSPSSEHEGLTGRVISITCRTGGATPTPTPTPTPSPTIVRIYDTGSGTETVPVNAIQVAVEIWYPGGGGSRNNDNTSERGGGSGAYSIKTVPLTSVNWGQTFAYNCGTAGLGRTGSNGNGGDASGGSITSSLTGVTVNLAPGTAAQGGVNNGCGVGGGTPSGGDINQAGNTTCTSAGAGAPGGGGNVPPGHGGSVPGGGGGGGATANANGANGASGRCKFTYTLVAPGRLQPR